MDYVTRTDVPDDLLEQIEKHSGVLWANGKNPTDMENPRRFLILRENLTLAHTHHPFGYGRLCLSGDDFLEKCIELSPKKYSNMIGKTYWYYNDSGVWETVVHGVDSQFDGYVNTVNTESGSRITMRAKDLYETDDDAALAYYDDQINNLKFSLAVNRDLRSALIENK